MQPYATHNVKMEEPVYSQGCVSVKAAGQGNTVDKVWQACHTLIVQYKCLNIFVLKL